MIRSLFIASAVLALLPSCAAMTSHSASGSSAAYTAAVADTARPTADTARDADRKPAETLAFLQLKPGDKVVDFIAFSGYFTRLFADVVGPKGHVYAVQPTEMKKYLEKPTVELQAYASSHPNITVIESTVMGGLKFPEKIDAFWISQNYHDLKDKFLGPVDTAAFNKAVYDALKPGGIYVVLDHVALAGAPADVTETLHRIDPAVVRREVEAAGFKFEGESKILANPADPHTAKVFDPSIRAHTDQFIYRFRKPRH